MKKVRVIKFAIPLTVFFPVTTRFIKSAVRIKRRTVAWIFDVLRNDLYRHRVTHLAISLYSDKQIFFLEIKDFKSGVCAVKSFIYESINFE